MQISPISFGKVIAVSGKSKSMRKLHYKAQNIKDVAIRDVTQYYMYTPDQGLLSQAAKSGQSVELYITGNDKKAYDNKENGWETTSEILSHMDKYLSLRNTNIDQVLNSIKESRVEVDYD